MVIVLGTSIVLQLVAAGLALWNIRHTRRAWGWVLVAAALVLMTVRRCVTFYRMVGGDGRTPDPSTEWVSLAISVLLVIGVASLGPLFISLSRSNEALQDSEARFRQLADAMPQMVWTARPDGYLDYYNERWYEFTGLPRGDGGDQSWEPILHPDDVQKCKDIWYSAVRTGEPYEIEYRFKDRTTGEYRWHLGRALPVRDAAGNIAKWFGTCTDIHDQRRAEANLSESEDRFGVMTDNIPQLAWMAHPDGHIFWYNRRWYVYTGTTFEQMQGWGWQSVHDPAELPRIVERWRAALARGEPWEDTFPLRRHDGQMRWHLSRAMPVRDGQGGIVRWFGTNTDITDRRQAEQEREQLLESERAARTEAERHSRMKDEFLATLSHELRTPLNAILGWSQVLARGGNNREDLQEGLAVIGRNARVQTQLIEDLLDMSRIISGKVRLDVQRVELPTVIEAAAEAVQHAADAKRIRLQQVLDPLAGPVSGDPNRLQQVVWNLLSNAIRFTPADGRVQVLLERVNSHVEITVSDSGQGIRPEFLPHVFDRFRQADSSTTRRHGGLGLGLAIVKHLVELHGGTVRAKSPGEGQGATFVVHLPLTVVHGDNAPGHRVHPQSGAGADDLCDPPKLTGVRVLVVDDEPDAAALVRRVLEDCGAEVLTASGGREGLESLDRNGADVLLSDIGMPDMDGYEMMRAARAKGVATPAAALTAYARSEDRRRAMMAGFQTHVAKPVEPNELVAVVASLAGRTG